MGNQQSAPHQESKESPKIRDLSNSPLHKPTQKKSNYYGLDVPIPNPPHEPREIFKLDSFGKSTTTTVTKPENEKPSTKQIDIGISTGRIMKDIEKIKNECPPCPKYDFENSDEARLIRAHINNTYSKLGATISLDMMDKLITNFLNSFGTPAA